MRIFRILATVAVCLLLTVGLTACKEKPEIVRSITLSVQTEQDLQQLEQYPDLQQVDLRGSNCYEAILAYAEAHPQVEVTYDVELGGTRYDNRTESLTYRGDSLGGEQLWQDLQYLPSVTKVEVPDDTLAPSQLRSLVEKYPAVSFCYSVEIAGRRYGADTTQLDLSEVDPAYLENVIPAADALVKLQEVKLNRADGSSVYSMAQVKKLMDALPGVTVHYSFVLYGKTVSTTDERVEFVKVDIGNGGVSRIREALDILPNCTYFKLDRCGIDDLTMEKLRDDYPNVKIVWRIFFAYYNCLTDTEVLRCINKLDDENVKPLKYCTDVKYMDFGHNVGLKNFEFLNYMPKLEIVIVVDSDIESLEPFTNCPNLQWLEIVNCQKLRDLSPLAKCKNLKGVNIAANPNLRDLTPLYELKNLERLFLGDKKLSKKQLEEAQAALPNTWITQARRSSEMVSYNYSYGWRLEKDGSRAEWYLFVRKIFRYDENYYNHYLKDGQ